MTDHPNGIDWNWTCKAPVHFSGDGGFVIHKIRAPEWCGRCSAWYAKDGTLLDAERFDRLNRNYPIKRNGPSWRRLASIGEAFTRSI